MFKKLDNVTLLGLYFALNVPVNSLASINQKCVLDKDKLYNIVRNNYSLWEEAAAECESRGIDIFNLRVSKDII